MGKVTKNLHKKFKILDTGCGDTAKVSIGMVKLGCKDITLCDVGDNWQKNVEKFGKL